VQQNAEPQSSAAATLIKTGDTITFITWA